MGKSNEPHNPSLAIDSEMWEIITEEFQDDPGGANTLAHVLFDLRAAMTSGRKVRLQMAASLTEGIRTAYLYTNEHKLAAQLYELELSGDLTPENEPLTLLEGAIERGSREVKNGLRRQKRRKH
jgi:hypothetical protein